MGLEEDEAPSPTPPLPITPAADAQKEDPFVVKLDRNDPNHPQVCIPRHFSRQLTGIG